LRDGFAERSECSECYYPLYSTICIGSQVLHGLSVNSETVDGTTEFIRQ